MRCSELAVFTPTVHFYLNCLNLVQIFGSCSASLGMRLSRVVFVSCSGYRSGLRSQIRWMHRLPVVEMSETIGHLHVDVPARECGTDNPRGFFRERRPHATPADF